MVEKISFIKDVFLGGAEEDAAEAQERAGERGIAESRLARQEARADLQPFREFGGRFLNTLGDFLSTDPNTDLERAEGFRDIERSAASGGKLRSGGTLRALTEFNSMLNRRNRADRFNELFNAVTMGQNAAAGQATSTLATSRDIADTTLGIGNAQAAGRVGSANATRNTLFSLLNLALG